MKNLVFSKNRSEDEDSQWLPVSDLMSGLMVLFLFIAISLILQVNEMMFKVKEVVKVHQSNEEKLYLDLFSEFKEDLPKWGADIDKKSLTVTFKSPELLFETGRSDLKPLYQAILSDFFPRYLKVIYSHKEIINEIRIEGHTSSEWGTAESPDIAYFENMRLSQDRTRAVLQFVYHIESVRSYQSWIKENLAAVGLSSAKIIKDEYQQENKDASKRVTFRIITNADEQINKIQEVNQ